MDGSISLSLSVSISLSLFLFLYHSLSLSIYFFFVVFCFVFFCFFFWKAEVLCYRKKLIHITIIIVKPFNKAWTQVLHMFKSCLWRVGGLQWWKPLTMVPTGNKVYRLPSVNHSAKRIRHHNLFLWWYYSFLIIFCFSFFYFYVSFLHGLSMLW